VLAANGGGTLLNILSSASWVSVPTGYAASKAAMWSATNALRVVLRPQGTQVIALQVGVADGSIEVLADESTRDLKSRLSMKAEGFCPWLDQQLAGFVP